MTKKIKLVSILAFCLSTGTSLFANAYFTGFAGAKVNFGVQNNSSDNSKVDVNGNIEAYLSGQINITPNILFRGEFSIKTTDLIDTSIFTTANTNSDDYNSLFQIDEISLIYRRTLLDSTNYLAAFVGTYEPIGSDVLLRRQFGVQQVASRLMENWLGLSSSVIYPLFGFGISDVIHFAQQPMCIGLYAYVNQQYEVKWMNFDARYAGVYRFFTFDVAGGIGFPLRTSNQQDAWLVIDRLLWRAGANILIGNAYTTSLFIQGGVVDMPFTQRDNIDGTAGKFLDAYFLIEPRIKTNKFQLHMGVFHMPATTAKNIMFIDSFNHISNSYSTTASLGVNMDLFTDVLYIKNKTFVFGIDSSLTLPGVGLDSLIQGTLLANSFANNNFTIQSTPYLSTKFNNGDLKAALKVNITKFYDGYNDILGAFAFSIGYKSQL